MEKQEGGVKHVFAKMADNTAMHGLPNVKNRKSLPKRIFWLFVILAALALLLWQITSLIIKYRSYPVSTSTEIIYSPVLSFPAITICNLNPVKSSAEGIPKDFQALLQQSAPSRPPRPGSGGPGSGGTPGTQGSGTQDGGTQDGGTQDGGTQGGGTQNGGSQGGGTQDGGTQGGGTQDGGTQDGGTQDGGTQDGGTQDGGTQDGGTQNGGTQTGDGPSGAPKPPDSANLVSADSGSDTSGADTSTGSYTSPREDFLMAEELYYTFMTMDVEQRSAAGHSMNEMLLDCSWKGKTCGPQNFTTFSNWHYGNCYTFNAGVDREGNEVEIETVNSPGALKGLMLKLYTQAHEYVDVINSPVGFHLVVHNQSHVPFPETEGILIQAGTYTQIGIKKTYVSREDPPHGTCQNFTKTDGSRFSAYVSDAFPAAEYTRQGCINTCVQRAIMLACNCSSYKFPSEGKPFEDLDGNVTAACEYDTDTNLCITEQEVLAQENCTLAETCPDRCVDFQYQLQATVAAWPTTEQQSRILGELADLASESEDSKLIKTIAEINESPGARSEFVGQNLLTVKIFFEDLAYISYVTESSFGIEDFLSALGGTGGLWLGISVVTIFELIEVFLDIIGIYVGSENKVTDQKRASVGKLDKRSEQPEMQNPTAFEMNGQSYRMSKIKPNDHRDSIEYA